MSTPPQGKGGAAGTSDVGGMGGSGGDGIDPAWQAFCDDASQVQSFCGLEPQKCEASATCADVLLYGPGSELFDCITDYGCECLGPLYFGEQSPEAEAFTVACVESQKTCPVFEDFCFAGALFEPSYLQTIAACLELNDCEAIRACARDTYGRCVGWAYAFDF